MLRKAFLATVLLAAALPALAADGRERRIRQDEIVLQLQAEEWVETKTAKVVAVVQTVLSGDQAGQQGSRVPAVLTDLVPGAAWHIVSFERSRDPSGLERWQITAGARMPEAQLGGLYDRARAASRPGQQVEIAFVSSHSLRAFVVQSSSCTTKGGIRTLRVAAPATVGGYPTPSCRGTRGQ